MASIPTKWVLPGLQSPFTWGSPLLSEEQCVSQLDMLCLLGSAWTTVLERLQIGYSTFQNGNSRRGRAQLAACFIPLLPTFGPRCDIVDDYRQALRHVLDTTWACMALTDQMGGGRQQIDALLQRFIDSISPSHRLPAKQRAALLAIRSKLDHDDDLMLEAIRLDPGEGEWKLHAGWAMEISRGPPGVAPPPSSRELQLLRDAFRLRPSPDTSCRLARSLCSAGKRGREEAGRLLEEAAARWPDHPRVLYQTALEYLNVHGSSDQSKREQVKKFERLLEVVGECAYVHSKLSAICKMAGMLNESWLHYNRALDLNPAVEEVDKDLLTDLLRAKK